MMKLITILDLKHFFQIKIAIIELRLNLKGKENEVCYKGQSTNWDGEERNEGEKNQTKTKLNIISMHALSNQKKNVEMSWTTLSPRNVLRWKRTWGLEFESEYASLVRV